MVNMDKRANHVYQFHDTGIPEPKGLPHFQIILPIFSETASNEGHFGFVQMQVSLWLVSSKYLFLGNRRQRLTDYVYPL